MPKHTMQVSEAFGVWAGVAMEVFGVIESIKNIGNIWNDDSLTTGEKIF